MLPDEKEKNQEKFPPYKERNFLTAIIRLRTYQREGGDNR